MNFNATANLRAAILDDLTRLAADREANAIEPEDATQAAQLLILRYLTEVIIADDLAEQFAACVGMAAESEAK